MLISDRRTPFLTTFNFTFLDIHHSRAGVVTRRKPMLADAIALFEADSQRRLTLPSGASHSQPSQCRALLLVSFTVPKQLLIYDES
jgi:hypothetical protein